MHMYGVVTTDGAHIDVSRSEKGAKQYATRRGYDKVSIRYNNGYVVVVISIKSKSGRWKMFTD